MGLVWLGLDARDGDVIYDNGKTLHVPDRAIPAAVRFLEKHPYIGLRVYCNKPSTDKHYELDISSVNDRLQTVHAPASVLSDGTVMMSDNNAGHNSDTAIYKLFENLKRKEIQGMYMAGSTPALMRFGCRTIGRLKGIKACSLYTRLPVIPSDSERKEFYLLDSGASAGVDSAHLRDIALLAHSYCKGVKGIKQPVLGFLSNGTESTKGTEIIRDAIKLTSRYDVSCVGQIEPRQYLHGEVDAVVVDGLLGNAQLKQLEALVEITKEMVREEFNNLTFIEKILGALPLKKLKTRISARIDREKYEGAPLLGFPHVVVKGHSEATESEIFGGLEHTLFCVEQSIPAKVNVELQRILEKHQGNSLKLA